MEPALLLLIPAGFFLWKRRAATQQEAAAARGEDIGERVAGFVADIAESDLMQGVQTAVADVLGFEGTGPPPLESYSKANLVGALDWHYAGGGGKEPGPIHAYGVAAVEDRLAEIRQAEAEAAAARWQPTAESLVPEQFR